MNEVESAYLNEARLQENIKVVQKEIQTAEMTLTSLDKIDILKCDGHAPDFNDLDDDSFIKICAITLKQASFNILPTRHQYSFTNLDMNDVDILKVKRSTLLRIMSEVLNEYDYIITDENISYIKMGLIGYTDGHLKKIIRDIHEQVLNKYSMLSVEAQNRVKSFIEQNILNQATQLKEEYHNLIGYYTQRYIDSLIKHLFHPPNQVTGYNSQRRLSVALNMARDIQGYVVDLRQHGDEIFAIDLEHLNYDSVSVLLTDSQERQLPAAMKEQRYPRLYAAIEQQNGDEIEQCLNAGLNIAYLDESGQTPISHALSNKDYNALEILQPLNRLIGFYDNPVFLDELFRLNKIDLVDIIKYLELSLSYDQTRINMTFPGNDEFTFDLKAHMTYLKYVLGTLFLFYDKETKHFDIITHEHLQRLDAIDVVHPNFIVLLSAIYELLTEISQIEYSQNLVFQDKSILETYCDASIAMNFIENEVYDLMNHLLSDWQEDITKYNSSSRLLSQETGDKIVALSHKLLQLHPELLNSTNPLNILFLSSDAFGNKAITEYNTTEWKHVLDSQITDKSSTSDFSLNLVVQSNGNYEVQERSLKESHSKTLFDNSGDILLPDESSSLEGRCLVRPLYESSDNPIAYMKFFPKLPLRQIFSDMLCSRLSGYSGMNTLGFVEHKLSGLAYPVIISRAIGMPGDINSPEYRHLLSWEFRNKSKTIEENLDPNIFTWNFIQAYLLQYGDGSSDNVFPQCDISTGKYVLVHGDADSILVDDTFKGDRLLYNVIDLLMSQMNSVMSKRVIRQFLALDHFAILKNITNEFEAIASCLDSLGSRFNIKSINRKFSSKDTANPRQYDMDCQLLMLFRDDDLPKLFERFIYLSEHLINMKGEVTHADCFASLMPRAATEYKEIRIHNATASATSKYLQLNNGCETETKQIVDFNNPESSYVYTLTYSRTVTDTPGLFHFRNGSKTIRDITYLKRQVADLTAFYNIVIQLDSLINWVVENDDASIVINAPSEYVRENVLNRLDWCDPKLSSKTIGELQSCLTKSKVSSLNLRDNSISHANILKHINFNKSLRHLTVSNCMQVRPVELTKSLQTSYVTNLTLNSLAETTSSKSITLALPYLTTLELRNLNWNVDIIAPMLSKLTAVNFIHYDGTMFSKVSATLNYLRLEDIQTVFYDDVEKTLDLTQLDLTNLDYLKIKDSQLKRLKINVTQLMKLDLRDCTSLHVIKFNGPGVPRIEIDNCLRLPFDAVKLLIRGTTHHNMLKPTYVGFNTSNSVIFPRILKHFPALFNHSTTSSNDNDNLIRIEKYLQNHQYFFDIKHYDAEKIHDLQNQLQIKWVMNYFNGDIDQLMGMIKQNTRVVNKPIAPKDNNLNTSSSDELPIQLHRSFPFLPRHTCPQCTEATDMTREQRFVSDLIRNPVNLIKRLSRKEDKIKSKHHLLLRISEYITHLERREIRLVINEWLSLFNESSILTKLDASDLSCRYLPYATPQQMLTFAKAIINLLGRRDEIIDDVLLSRLKHFSLYLNNECRDKLAAAILSRLCRGPDDYHHEISRLTKTLLSLYPFISDRCVEKTAGHIIDLKYPSIMDRAKNTFYYKWDDTLQYRNKFIDAIITHFCNRIPDDLKMKWLRFEIENAKINKTVNYSTFYCLFETLPLNDGLAFISNIVNQNLITIFEVLPNSNAHVSLLSYFYNQLYVQLNATDNLAKGDYLSYILSSIADPEPEVDVKSTQNQDRFIQLMITLYHTISALNDAALITDYFTLLIDIINLAYDAACAPSLLEMLLHSNEHNDVIDEATAHQIESIVMFNLTFYTLNTDLELADKFYDYYLQRLVNRGVTEKTCLDSFTIF